MNVLIAYYSKGGRTAKVAQEIYNTAPDEKAIIRIEPTKKEGGFFRCLAQAKGKEKITIKGSTFDCAPYDAIILGTPVWDGRPSPFVTAWIDGAQNLDGKKIALVATCRIGAGKTIDIAEDTLKAKEANITDNLILKSLFKLGSNKLKEAQEFGKKFIKA